MSSRETHGQLGRCDFKQYEHCGPHERIPEIGQRLPPFGCKNWKPGSAAIHRASDAREPWLTMDRPDYPSHCNNCGYEGTNESMEKHECASDTPEDEVTADWRNEPSDTSADRHDDMPNRQGAIDLLRSLRNVSAEEAEEQRKTYAELEKSMSRICKWTLDSVEWESNKWDSDCGESFTFEVGGPEENKMKFCCYCGKRLKEVIQHDNEA